MPRSPALGPSLMASWNDDIALFVKLVHRRMSWGEAVMRLKNNRAKLRADVIARADQVSAELSKMERAQYDRRTAIVTSVIGILP
jgi:chorismate mutase